MIRPFLVAVAVTTTALAASACGSDRPPQASTATTSASSPLASDHWKPPVVPGPPSTTKFCTLLVANYDHLGTDTRATSLKVRQQIVGDFTRFTPTVIAAAPTEIAAPASAYLGGIAKILGLLNSAGLNAAKAPPGSIGAVLLDPQFKAAGAPVTAFVQQNCHYDISGMG